MHRDQKKTWHHTQYEIFCCERHFLTIKSHIECRNKTKKIVIAVFGSDPAYWRNIGEILFQIWPKQCCQMWPNVANIDRKWGKRHVAKQKSWVSIWIVLGTTFGECWFLRENRGTRGKLALKGPRDASKRPNWRIIWSNLANIGHLTFGPIFAQKKVLDLNRIQ